MFSVTVLLWISRLIVLCIFPALQLWDATTSQAFAYYNEHEERAWSVDFSLIDPARFASGSDDCSVKLWNMTEVCMIVSPFIVLAGYLLQCCFLGNLKFLKGLGTLVLHLLEALEKEFERGIL